MSKVTQRSKLNKKIAEFVRANPSKYTITELASMFDGATPDSVRGMIKRDKELCSLVLSHYDKQLEVIQMATRKTSKEISVEAKLEGKIAKTSAESLDTKRKYKAVQTENKVLRQQVKDAIKISGKPRSFKVAPRHSSKVSEGTYVMVASDWHVEETVSLTGTLGRNEYSLKIAEERAKMFFANGHRLLKIYQKDLKVDTVVVALLGDFISGHLHPELVETCSLPPAAAALYCRGLLKAGFEYLLEDKSIKQILVPCHSGNHGRSTPDYRQQTEYGHSWEWMMYHLLKADFAGNKRIKFEIADEAQYTILPVYSYTLRLHHGHSIKYGGGVGGITIPVNKAIAQWSKPAQWEDEVFKTPSLDVFGHFHQRLDGGWFVCNGSMIGYNQYAMAIKAGYQRPEQASFIIDRDRGKTFDSPILFI